MKTKRHYYLMISCPGDVIQERQLLKDCVEIINSERSDDVWVELQYWATDTSSDAGMLAQDSINEQLVKESDGLIAIFNARLGTPVHEYKCGTDEEIALMLKENKHVSLLFNTRPKIDLSNPTSIEQITKLQEYKIEQSQKAYYREFCDEESFMALARREILLWLRKISNTTPDIETQNDTESSFCDHSNRNDENISSCSNKTELSVELESSQNGNPQSITVIDEDAGVLDCVVYITDAADALTENVNSFIKYNDDLSVKTNIFVDKINVIKKQKNGNAGVLLLCKSFADDVNKHRDSVDELIDNIEIKWNEVYQYLLIFKKNQLNNEDKVIIKDSVNSLKECFGQALPNIDKLVDSYISVPNVQKNVKSAMNGLSFVYKRFKALIIKMIENCEELDDLFTIEI